MERRRWLILLALSLVIAPIFFELGRRSFSATSPSLASQTKGGFPQPQTEQRKRSGPAEQKNAKKEEFVGHTTDYSKIKIENLGRVPFDHAYELLRSAPKEALAKWTKDLENLPIAPRKTAAINVFFKTLAQIDTATAVDLALTMNRADPRWAAIWAVASAAPPGNLSEIARMFTSINERRIEVADGLIERWSETDPEATARFIANYPGKIANDGIAAFLGNWAATDPAAAENWLTKADSSRRDEMVYASFYRGWLLGNREGALADLASHAADKTFRRAIKFVTEDVYTQSTETARGFVMTLSDDEAQREAIDQVTGHVTGIYFGGDYLHLEAEAVTKWVMTFPESLWQDRIGNLVSEWAKSDPTAVETWINQMPLQIRDRILAEQCRAFDWDSPSSAFQAGLRICDPALRQNTFRKLFEKMDEELKRELLEKAELSADQARELNRILERQ